MRDWWNYLRFPAAVSDAQLKKLKLTFSKAANINKQVHKFANKLKEKVLCKSISAMADYTDNTFNVDATNIRKNLQGTPLKACLKLAYKEFSNLSKAIMSKFKGAYADHKKINGLWTIRFCDKASIVENWQGLLTQIYLYHDWCSLSMKIMRK